MNRLADNLRLLLVSPEALLMVTAIAVCLFLPGPLESIAKWLSDNMSVGVAAAVSPLAGLTWGWSQTWEMLDPRSHSGALADWPDYPMLRRRALACLAWCGAGTVTGLAGLALTATQGRGAFGAALLGGGILAASSALVSLALARISLREMLSTQ